MLIHWRAPVCEAWEWGSVVTMIVYFQRGKKTDTKTHREAEKQKLGRGDVVRWAIYSLERRTG